MALTQFECWQLALHTTFQARVRFCLNKPAVAVFAEPLATPGHTERLAFAKNVLAGNYRLEQVGMAVWTDDALKQSGNINNDVTSGITDPELQAAIDGLFSTLAGYPTSA